MKKMDMYRYAAKANEGIAINFPSTAGVYHDFRNKVAVATDGYILRISRAAYDPQYECDDKDGVSIGRNGEVIEGRFVVYGSVIPDYGRKSHTRVIDKKQVLESVKQAKEKAKKNGVKRSVVFVKVNGLWVKEKYLKMAMGVIDETIHPDNTLQNKNFYGNNNGEEVLISWHPGFDIVAGNDTVVFWDYKNGMVFSC